jgi:hypothetical protein
MTQRHNLSYGERVARDKGKAWLATGCLGFFVLIIVAAILATR